MSIQTPFVTPFVSIRDFGAVPNDPRPAARVANSESLKQAQAAMKSDPFAWGHPLFIPSGTFYLADDLHISKSLELFGTGVQGESILMFPAILKITNEALGCLTSAGVPDPTVAQLQSLLGKEFLDAEELMKSIEELIGDGAAAAYQAEILRCAFFRGTSLIIDPVSKEDPASIGSDSMIRDLQIISEENWTYGAEDSPFDPSNFDPPTFEGTSTGTPGIKMHSPAIVQRVYITGFTGTGIYIFAGGDSDANYWRIHDAYIATCGGHGIHVDGGETQGGLCTGAKMLAIGGSGVINSPGGGNTYVGCYVFTAKGRGYASDAPGQNTFVGCWSEAGEKVSLTIGGHVWIGGGSGPGFTDDTTAFIAESYGNVHPFEVPNLKDPQIKLFVGYPNDATDPTTISAWQNNNGEYYVMRWDMENKIWATEDGAVVPVVDINGNFVKLRELTARHIANYLTGSGHPRGPWLQGLKEMLLGPVNDSIKISRGDLPADAEPGDIVYNATPRVGEYIGHVCIANGPAREWKPFGKIEEPPLEPP